MASGMISRFIYEVKESETQIWACLLSELSPDFGDLGDPRPVSENLRRNKRQTKRTETQ